MPIPIGLMGCGAVADYGHLPAINQTTELKLHSIYDPDPARLARVQAQYPGVRTFTDPEAFFNSGIEAVTITSPAPAHLANVLAAAAHRKPVLCEKPLAMNDAEARQMIDAMRQAGCMLFTAFCYRFAPAALRIKQLVADGAIGDLLALRLNYLWDLHGKFNRRDPSMGIQLRREGRMLEGGPMTDCGTHQIDLAIWWTGSPVVRYTGIGAWLETYDAPDHMWLHMDHANGAHTCVEISYSFGHTLRQRINRFEYELIGTAGVIRYDREQQLFEWHDAAGPHTEPFSHEKNFERMYAAFAAALRTGEPGHLTTAEQGLIVTDIARRSTEQAIANRLVTPRNTSPAGDAR